MRPNLMRAETRDAVGVPHGLGLPPPHSDERLREEPAARSSSSLGIQEPGLSPRVARFRYTKLGKIRFTSHRDVGRMWERALRKVALAVAYTSGFSPRPRIAFGFALPTGAESVAEYVDIGLALDKAHELSDIPARLTPALPDGLEVTGGVILPPGSPALQAAVTSSTWRLTLQNGNSLSERLAEFLASPSFEIQVERKGSQVRADIRPGVLAAELTDDNVIICDLSAKGTRPGDFLRALGADPLEARMLRTQQWIDYQGSRAEPLAPGAYFAAPAVAGGGPEPHADTGQGEEPFVEPGLFREERIDVRPEPVPAFAAAPSPARHAGRT